MKLSSLFRKQKTNKEVKDQSVGKAELDILFDTLKKENNDQTFPAVENWLRNINSQDNENKNFKSERILFNMRSPKFKLVYMFLLLAFIIAACNYPVTQEEPLADVIKWTVDQRDTEAISKVNELNWTKDAVIKISDSENGNSIAEYSLVVPKEDHSKSQIYMDRLKLIEGVMTINIVPLNEKVTRPVYSMALNEIFKVDINATNMSDEELKNQITTQLEQNGINGVQISFEKNADGRRVSKIFIPESAIKNNDGFDLRIEDGDDKNKTLEVRKFRNKNDGEADRFKNKSDEEIKKMVMEDLQNKNINPEDIQIVRKGDKIMINISKKSNGNETEEELQFEGEIGK